MSDKLKRVLDTNLAGLHVTDAQVNAVLRRVSQDEQRPRVIRWQAIAAVLLGGISGGIMMLIPAGVKAKLGGSDMFNSLMLNYAVMYFIKYLLNTHLADKTKGQIMTYEFQPNAAIPQLEDNGSNFFCV